MPIIDLVKCAIFGRRGTLFLTKNKKMWRGDISHMVHL